MPRLSLPLVASLAALLVACDCGDDTGPMFVAPKPVEAGAQEGFDANVPAPPMRDTGLRIPGSPPDDGVLMGNCVIDTNKIFDLVSTNAPPQAAPLAVDQIESRFGMAYVARGDCLDAVYVAELKGPAGSGVPEVSKAVDECSRVENPSLAHTGSSWLLAFVDNREDNLEIWTQPFDPRDAAQVTATRITTSDQVESQLALLDVGEFSDDQMMLAWVARARNGSANSLMVRPLDDLGVPTGDAVTLADSSAATGESFAEWNYTSVRMAPLISNGVALVYRRFNADASEIVLEILDRAGERTKDSWVITREAGPQGNADVAFNKDGGGVIYTRAVGTTGRQVWFQELNPNGDQAQVEVAGMPQGPAPEKRLVNAPKRAIDVSLGRIPIGFVAAYRVLELELASGLQPARIELVFVDRVGAFIQNTDLVFSTEAGGPTSVGTGYDGRIVVGWSDITSGSETLVRMVRLPCVGG